MPLRKRQKLKIEDLLISWYVKLQGWHLNGNDICSIQQLTDNYNFWFFWGRSFWTQSLKRRATGLHYFLKGAWGKHRQLGVTFKVFLYI